MDTSFLDQVSSYQIGELLDAVINRYNVLFPQWEATVLVVERCSKNQQIDNTIRLLEGLKDL